MDPLTLILTALGAGAIAGGQAIADEAVKDSYKGLKTLIGQKLSKKPQAELILTEHEADPATWKTPLKKALAEEGVDQDPQILEAARKMLELVQSQQAAMGKYTVQIAGDVQGYAQGDYQQVTMHFGTPPKDK